MKSFFSFFALVVFLTFSLSAHADVNGPGTVGEASPVQQGGANASPVKTLMSTANSTAQTAKNSREAADDGKKAMALSNAQYDARSEENKANHTYSAYEERSSHRQQAGKDALEQFGPTKSQFAALQLSAATATLASSGVTGQAALRMYDGWPHSDVGKDGSGGTAIEAANLLQAMCQVKDCLPQFEAKELGKKFGSCQGGAGLCLSVEGMKGLKTGIKLGKGQPHTDIVAMQLSMAAFGRRTSVMSAALGYTPRQLVQADIKQYLAAKQGKHYAVYRNDDVDLNNLLHRVDARNGAEDVQYNYMAIGRAMETSKAKEALLKGYESYISLPNKGPDIYQRESEQAQAATGEQPCYDKGMYASSYCQARNAVGASVYRMASIATEKQNAPQMNAQLASMQSTGEMAKARVAQITTGGGGADASVVQSGFQTFAEIMMMPEFRAFVASLDEKTLKDMDAKNRQELAELNNEVGTNYLAFLHERGSNGDTQFADSNEPSSPSLGQLFSGANIMVGAPPVVTPVSYQQAAPMQAMPIAATLP